MRKEYTGICCLCGLEKKLSFEHVPPRSALNNKLVYTQNAEQLSDTISKKYQTKNRSPRGFGGYTLCETCNKRTGSWYANDYADFAIQGIEIIKGYENPAFFIEGKYKIKPLNVIKQILVMFMSADKVGHYRSNKALVDFLLNKESIGISTTYNIYMYSNLSIFHRLFGYTVTMLDDGSIQKWAEINFKPFGFLLTENSIPAHPKMVDITDFTLYSYNEIAEVSLSLPYLEVINPIIGMYDNQHLL
jgi:hypothetical protein